MGRHEWPAISDWDRGTNEKTKKIAKQYSKIEKALKKDKTKSSEPKSMTVAIGTTRRLSPEAEKEVWKAIASVIEKNPNMNLQDAAREAVRILKENKQSEYSKDRERFEQDREKSSPLQDTKADIKKREDFMKYAKENDRYLLTFLEFIQNYDLPKSVRLKEYERFLKAETDEDVHAYNQGLYERLKKYAH